MLWWRVLPPSSLPETIVNYRPLRLVHITMYRDLPSGIRKQITWEQLASKHLKGIEWTSLVVHGGEAVEPFEKRIPFALRLMFLRNLYVWLIVIRLSRAYDLVLLRHIPFDPFVFLFAPLIRNRVSVHHSREWQELPLIRPGLAGRLAGSLELISGWFSVRCAIGVLGVTNEIARFQVDRRAPAKPAGLYANGISLDDVEVVDDLRSSNSVHVVFISNTFSEWHGLDRLVNSVRQSPMIPYDLTFHIIGHLSKLQKMQITELGLPASLFRLHGFLATDAYRSLLSTADIGLGSLAMDRQSLTEGATLKVREMLGMGIAVYSGHTDTALPASFPFYRKVSSLDLAALERFARSMKQHSRLEIRKAAAPFIDKVATMQVAADWLSELHADLPDR